MILMGMPYATQGKPDDEKEKTGKENSDKIEAVEAARKDKERKAEQGQNDDPWTIEKFPDAMMGKPFSVSGAGATAVLRGLSLPVVGCTRSAPAGSKRPLPTDRKRGQRSR